MTTAHDTPETLCGIILHPAGHTRSPAMHRAAYAALGLKADYRVFDVPPEGLAEAIATLRQRGIRQLSVSIPHKEAILAHLDEMTPEATRIGAVNTVVSHGGRWVGSNTDCPGAIRALERAGPLSGKHAVVLGAGGAARAVVYGLIEAGSRVTVLNRTEERAEKLVDELGADRSGSLLEIEDTAFDVLVNTTSVGLREDISPIAAGAHRSGSVVMDAVYDPPQTRLLKEASAAGAHTVGGKWMLVYQAVLQLEAWCERDAPVDVMEEAFDNVSG